MNFEDGLLNVVASPQLVHLIGLLVPPQKSVEDAKRVTNRGVSSSTLEMALALHQESGPPLVLLPHRGGMFLQVIVKTMMGREGIHKSSTMKSTKAWSKWRPLLEPSSSQKRANAAAS